jgi:hypothetical protein
MTPLIDMAMPTAPFISAIKSVVLQSSELMSAHEPTRVEATPLRKMNSPAP